MNSGLGAIFDGALRCSVCLDREGSRFAGAMKLLRFGHMDSSVVLCEPCLLELQRQLLTPPAEAGLAGRVAQAAQLVRDELRDAEETGDPSRLGLALECVLEVLGG